MSADKTEGMRNGVAMNKDKKLKQGMLILLVILSGTYLTLSFLEQDDSGEMPFSLSSLWKDPEDPFVAGGAQDMNSDSEQPEKGAIKKKVADDEDEIGDDEDLLMSVNFEELNEDLMEDKLWEDGILRSQPKGVRSGLAVLDALKEMDDWTPVKGGFSEAKLAVYLRHPKLWVRLAAFGFALKSEALNEEQESKMARLITLKGRDNPSQVRRFLTRYEESDPELFQRMMQRLVDSSLPAEEADDIEELPQELDDGLEENFES